ncbi:MAG: right-handed parallel beta-helix repeat-containing protein [Candidatus Babeliales bacterium]
MKRLLLILNLLFIFSMRADSVAIIISSPGEYSYSDLTIDPTDLNDCAISIQASDVIVDMSNGFIMQQEGNQIGGFCGIHIAPGLKNIIIRNISIKLLTGIGIQIDEGCENLTIENIMIRDCYAGGILCAGSMSNVIKEAIIHNCYVATCTGADGNPAYGIRLIQCNNVVVQDCIFNGNDGDSVASGFGLSLELCSACKVLNCNGNDNGGSMAGVGISLFQTQWTLVDNCNILNTIARASMNSKAVGISVNQGTHNIVRNCLVKHSNNSLVNSYGFEAFAGSNNLFVDCATKNNSAGALAAGFILYSSELRTSINHCISRANDGGVSGAGYGIYLNTAQNCDIWYNQLLNNTGATGCGLYDTVTNTTNLIAGNTAFGSSTCGFDVTRSSGSFPVVVAQVGDFTPTYSVSKYYNVDFNPGP